MAFVDIKNLVMRYDSAQVNAVDGVSFEIKQGEIFSLLGPNGAGKTTTISILTTLFRPTEGEAWIDGKSVIQDPMGVRQRIGVVPQELALYDDLSAAENLRFWGEMQGVAPGSLKQEIEEKLQLMELEDRARDRVKTFSGGMKRRLNLAIGLLGNPPFLMLDEPTVAIDPQSRRYILDWVKKMNEDGMTILYTTHYMEEAQELSHRIGIMDHGKLIAIGTLEELTKLVGQKETLTLTLTQEVDDRDLTDVIGGMDGVDAVTAVKDALILNVESAKTILSPIVQKVSDQGLTIKTIEIQEPNLEAVFLHLTGRALRD